MADKSKLSDLDKAKLLVSVWALRPALQRTFKLVCQPFLSQSEAEKSVLGQRSHSIRLKGSEFTTLSLPRLQLRGMAVIELSNDGWHYVKECENLLAQIQQ